MVSPFHPVYFNSEVYCNLPCKKPCSYQRLLWIFSWSYNLQSSWWFHLSILYILIVRYTVICHVKNHALISAYYEFSPEVTIFRAVDGFTFPSLYFNSEVYCNLPCKKPCSYQRLLWIFSWSYNLQSSWRFHLSILYILIVRYTVICHVTNHALISAYYEFSPEVTIFRAVDGFTFPSCIF